MPVPSLKMQRPPGSKTRGPFDQPGNPVGSVAVTTATVAAAEAAAAAAAEAAAITAGGTVAAAEAAASAAAEAAASTTGAARRLGLTGTDAQGATVAVSAVEGLDGGVAAKRPFRPSSLMDQGRLPT
jgi:hypothetical protein